MAGPNQGHNLSIQTMQKIGVISDTHGKLRTSALQALQGVDMIIHAGDSGGQAILQQLASIAPLHAVRGNCDFGSGTFSLPADLVVETAGGLFYVIHDLYMLGLEPAAADIRAVIHGHTHMPSITYRDDVLYINPGSAGPIRPGRPVSLSIITIDSDGKISPEIVTLQA